MLFMVFVIYLVLVWFGVVVMVLCIVFRFGVWNGEVSVWFRSVWLIW